MLLCWSSGYSDSADHRSRWCFYLFLNYISPHYTTAFLFVCLFCKMLIIYVVWVRYRKPIIPLQSQKAVSTSFVTNWVYTGHELIFFKASLSFLTDFFFSGKTTLGVFFLSFTGVFCTVTTFSLSGAEGFIWHIRWFSFHIVRATWPPVHLTTIQLCSIHLLYGLHIYDWSNHCPLGLVTYAKPQTDQDDRLHGGSAWFFGWPS